VTGPVALIDYGAGNLQSVKNALKAAGAENMCVTNDPAEVLSADRIVLPGVGAFAHCMGALSAIPGMVDALNEATGPGAKPFLGICVGMQVLFESGVEGGTQTAGLGEWPGVVRKLDAPILPHMGWNTVDAPADSVLFKGIADQRFYFVHSYAATEWSLDVIPPFPTPQVTWCTYGEPFIAAVENGPLSATQFHPEKSGEAGIRLITNWVNSL
jgi:glutamine amidotransferase